MFSFLLLVGLPLGAEGFTADTCLTQPLSTDNGRISVPLNDVRSVRSKLAPADTYNPAGVSRTYELNELEFTPTPNVGGAKTVCIGDRVPAVLVEPASYAAALIAQANPTISTDSEFAGGRAKPTQAKSRTYKTQPGDTLLKIVRNRMIDERFSLQQKMIATLRANPEAFIGNNINKLKTDRVLRLPNSAYIALVSRETARAEVARQYANWLESRATPPVGTSPEAAERAVETPPPSKEPARLEEASEGGVEIQAPYETDLQQDIVAAPGYGDLTELQEQVDLMRALAESRQQENEELSAENRELKEIIAQKDRLIKLQREKLARLEQLSPEKIDVSGPNLPEEASLSTEPTEPVKPTDPNAEQLQETMEEGAARSNTVSAVSDFFAIAFILSGLFFFIAGSIGLLRLPDIYSRLHALTKADNVGLGLLITGVLLLASDWLVAVKLVVVWILVLASSAASAHLIAQRARRQQRLMLKP